MRKIRKAKKIKVAKNFEAADRYRRWSQRPGVWAVELTAQGPRALGIANEVDQWGMYPHVEASSADDAEAQAERWG